MCLWCVRTTVREAVCNTDKYAENNKVCGYSSGDYTHRCIDGQCACPEKQTLTPAGFGIEQCLGRYSVGKCALLLQLDCIRRHAFCGGCDGAVALIYNTLETSHQSADSFAMLDTVCIDVLTQQKAAVAMAAFQ
jgi:hypothetical protein